jgi:ENTH domain
METLKKAASGLKHKLSRSEAEKLTERTVKGNGVLLKNTYYDIADKTYSAEDSKSIIKIIFSVLTPDEKDVSKILRALQLSDSLIKLGSPLFINDARSGLVRYRNFINFCAEGKSPETNSSVREYTKKILAMLTDNQILENERENARKLKEKSVGYSSEQYGNRNFMDAGKLAASDYVSSEIGDYKPPASWYDEAKINLNYEPKHNTLSSVPNELFKDSAGRYHEHKSVGNAKNDIFSGMNFKKDTQKNKTDIFSDLEIKNKKIEDVQPTFQVKNNTNEQNKPEFDIFQTKTLNSVFPEDTLVKISLPKPQESQKFNPPKEIFGLSTSKNTSLVSNSIDKPEESSNIIIQSEFPVTKATENLSSKKSDGNTLFGVPLKVKTDSKTPATINPLPSTLQKDVKTDLNLNKSVSTNDLLNIEIKFTDHIPYKTESSHYSSLNPTIIPLDLYPNQYNTTKIIKNPIDQNIFNNMSMKNPLNSQNQFKVPDPFNFDLNFPVLNIPEKSSKKILPQNLEASLMNIDELSSSLSNSIGPRTLDSIKL